MSALRLRLHSRSVRRKPEQTSGTHERWRGDRPAGPLDGELLDLYAAILITVPLALFLKALCT